MLWNTLNKLHTTDSVYPRDERLLAAVQYVISHARITWVDLFATTESRTFMSSTTDNGSTHKWLVQLQGGALFVFKPQWCVTLVV